MGKPETFEVIFDNGHGIYVPGNLVTGHVDLKLNEPLTTKGIRLVFHGGANVDFVPEPICVTFHHSRKRYKAAEEYFSHGTLLFGTLSGEEQLLQCGSYCYPFEFTLPLGIPPSFDDFKGYIRYTVTCIIIIPWGMEYKAVGTMSIHGYLDLNLHDNARLSATKYHSKAASCWCCCQCTADATFTVDRQGYVPGEEIVINAQITNGSDAPVTNSVELKMVKKFTDLTKVRLVYDTVVTLIHPPVGPYSTGNWSDVRLIVPPLQHSFLTGCKLIDVSYVIQLVAVTAAGPIVLPVDIIIGTVPFLPVTLSNPPPTGDNMGINHSLKTMSSPID